MCAEVRSNSPVARGVWNMPELSRQANLRQEERRAFFRLLHRR
jgi:hypothetical protein